MLLRYFNLLTYCFLFVDKIFDKLINNEKNRKKKKKLEKKR